MYDQKLESSLNMNKIKIKQQIDPREAGLMTLTTFPLQKLTHKVRLKKEYLTSSQKGRNCPLGLNGSKSPKEDKPKIVFQESRVQGGHQKLVRDQMS